MKPLAFGATPNAFVAEVAKDAPRGSWPRYLAGEQSYWAVVGVDGDADEGLLSEDGALEAGAGLFSVEPFLLDGERLVTWADVTTRHALDGRRPADPVGDVGGEGGHARDDGARGRPARLVGAPGALSRLEPDERREAGPPRPGHPPAPGEPAVAVPRHARRRLRDPVARVRERPRRRERHGARRPARGAVRGRGDGVRLGGRLGLPPRGKAAVVARAVTDPTGLASGAFAFDLELPAEGAREVVVAIPFDRAHAPPELAAAFGPEAWPGLLRQRRLGPLRRRSSRREREGWRSRLDRVVFDVPPEAERFVKVLKSQLAWILVNRDGPAIQPGSRSYARSWIRDGSLTSEALLRLGHSGAARSFLLWFAGFQGEDGRVPCCVDTRGADGVPENDSHGQLLFLIAETVRYTGDRGLAGRMWPHVVSAVSYLDQLRQKRRTAEYETPEKRVFYGLLPESISHEGYSAKPMHSYWDDFFGLRGLKDAVILATLLGKEAEAKEFARIRDEFAADLHASIRLVMERHGIDYLPGCAELGDFDATSTTAALAPGGEQARLPKAALERTFAKYLENVAKREAGEGEIYTPYEWRTVGALVRLGRRRRHPAPSRPLLPRPAPRRVEPVGRGGLARPEDAEVRRRHPAHLGRLRLRPLLPRPVRVRAGGGLVARRGRGAPRGVGPFRARRLGEGPRHALRSSRSRAYGRREGRPRPAFRSEESLPAGGLVVRPPLSSGARTATINGRPATLSPDGEVVVRSLPAEVVVQP